MADDFDWSIRSSSAPDTAPAKPEDWSLDPARAAATKYADQARDHFESLAEGANGYLSQPSTPERPNLLVTHEGNTLRFTGGDEGAKKFSERHAVEYGNHLRQYAPQLGAKDIDQREKEMQKHSFDAARLWQLKAGIAAYQGAGNADTSEFWTEHVPFWGLGEKIGNATSLYDAEKAFEAGTAKPNDYASIAHSIARQQADTQRGFGAGIGHAAADLGTFGTEFALSGGMAGGARAGAEAVGGRVLGQLGARTAGALAEGAVRTATGGLPRVLARTAQSMAGQPALDEQGNLHIDTSKWLPGEAGKAALGEAIDNTFFTFGKVFDAKTGTALSSIAKSTLEAMATAELSQDTQRLLHVAPEGGAAWRLLSAGNGEERFKAARDLVQNGIPMAILEAALHAKGSMRAKGIQVDDAKLGQTVAEQIVQQAVQPSSAPDTQQATGGQVPPAPAESSVVSGFTTAQGSTYTWENGQSQRTKAPHAGHEPGDVGVKNKSDKTVFLDPEHAREVGMWQSSSAEGKRVIVKDGEVILTSLNAKTGQRGSDGRFPFSVDPETGRSPLELWGKSNSLGKQGHEAYTGSHPGSPITAIHGAPDMPPEVAMKQAGESIQSQGAPVNPEALKQATEEIIHERTAPTAEPAPHAEPPAAAPAEDAGHAPAGARDSAAIHAEDEGRAQGPDDRVLTKKYGEIARSLAETLRAKYTELPATADRAAGDAGSAAPAAEAGAGDGGAGRPEPAGAAGLPPRSDAVLTPEARANAAIAGLDLTDNAQKRKALTIVRKLAKEQGTDPMKLWQAVQPEKAVAEEPPPRSKGTLKKRLQDILTPPEPSSAPDTPRSPESIEDLATRIGNRNLWDLPPEDFKAVMEHPHIRSAAAGPLEEAYQRTLQMAAKGGEPAAGRVTTEEQQAFAKKGAASSAPDTTKLSQEDRDAIGHSLIDDLTYAEEAEKINRAMGGKDLSEESPEHVPLKSMLAKVSPERQAREEAAKNAVPMKAAAKEATEAGYAEWQDYSGAWRPLVDFGKGGWKSQDVRRDGDTLRLKDDNGTPYTFKLRREAEAPTFKGKRPRQDRGLTDEEKRFTQALDAGDNAMRDDGVNYMLPPWQSQPAQKKGVTPTPPAAQTQPRPKTFMENLREWWAPASRGPEAGIAAGGLRHGLAEIAAKTLAAKHALEPIVQYFHENVVNAPDEPTRNARFLQIADAIEEPDEPTRQQHVAALPAELKPFVDIVRELNDGREQQLRDRDILKTFVNNYLGHLWEDPRNPKATPQELGAMLQGRRPLAGSEGFKKQRREDIPTYRDGIAAGLIPRDWNLAHMVAAKLREVDKSVMAHDLVENTLKPNGIWKFFGLGKSAPEGWQAIDDKIAKVFAPPQVDLKEYYDKEQMEGLENWAKAHQINLKRTMTGAPGQQSPGEVQTRFATPEEVLAHEIWHELDQRYGLRKLWTAGPIVQELRTLADLRSSGQTSQAWKDYVRSAPEKIANAGMAYFHAPELMQREAPHTYRAVEHFLDSRPELAGLKDIKPSLQLGEREQTMRLAGPMLTGHYYTPEPVATLMDNYLQPGLQGQPVYDAFRKMGNTLTNFQLGFTAFHAGFAVMDTQTSAVARGLQSISRGQYAKGIKEIATSPAAPVRNFLEGGKLMREGKEPGTGDPETQAMAENLMLAGGRFKMDEWYGGDAVEKFRQSLGDVMRGNAKQIPSMLARALPAVAEGISKPVMEHLVPRMKLGAFADMARDIRERLGPNASTNELRAELGKAWDSVENRLGQLTYDNLFWKRTLKDVLQAGVRSVGWNLGTVRELGGGLKDVPESFKGTMKGDGITPRTAYMVALPIVAGFYGAMYQYLRTGQGPDELKDYFFPKTGQKRKDGTDDRVSLPSYMRDVAGVANRADEGPLRVAQNVWTMAKHKANPMIGLVAEMLGNEDFYGTALRNPNDSAVKQSWDTAKHLALAFEPFGSRGFRQQQAVGSTPLQSAQSFVGITPAPAYITRSADQQRAIESSHKFQMTPLGKLQAQEHPTNQGTRRRRLTILKP